MARLKKQTILDLWQGVKCCLLYFLINYQVCQISEKKPLEKTNEVGIEDPNVQKLINYEQNG